MILPPQTNHSNNAQSPTSDSLNTPKPSAGRKTMPQNHRPGSTFGTPNKPQALGAQPMPQNHGYGVAKYGGNVNRAGSGGKNAPQNHFPGSTFGTPNKPSATGAPMPQNHRGRSK